MSKRMVLCGLLATSLMIVTMAGCGKSMDVSKEAYDKVETGMTLAQVEAILGKGELQTGGSGGIGNLTGSAKIYKWVDGDKTITITFVNEKVKTRMHTGL